jgi:hypothetical protein
MVQVRNSRNARLRRYFIAEGILDGLEAEPTVKDQFAAWDLQRESQPRHVDRVRWTGSFARSATPTPRRRMCGPRS